MKWAVKSYFAADERSKGEWNTLKTFERKEDAERFAQAQRDSCQLWTEYYVCEVRERIKITKTERQFIDIMNMAFRDKRVNRAKIDKILSNAASAIEAELFDCEMRVSRR